MVASVNKTKLSHLSSLASLESDAHQQKQLTDVDFHALSLEDDIGMFKLSDAYRQFVLDMQADIPFLIWLLENPKSALALPGNVDLYGHDCIHLLLNRGKSNFDEAFVIGFTMGNASDAKERHLKIFHTFATKFYPPMYRFNRYHMKSFDLGVRYGQGLCHKDINNVNFKLYGETTIQTLRDSLGISLEDLQQLCHQEKLWIQMEAVWS